MTFQRPTPPIEREYEFLPTGEHEWRVIDPLRPIDDPDRLVGFIEHDEGATYLWHLGHSHGRVPVPDVAVAVDYFRHVAEHDAPPTAP